IARGERNTAGPGSELGKGDLTIGTARNGLLEPSHANAWARRYIALKGGAWPSTGFSLGTERGGPQRRHCRSAVHQNSRRFKYSQLARMDANASPGWSCSTK